MAGPQQGLPDRIVAFDLETTGIGHDEHRIVEVAFILLDASLEELDRWQALVDPGRPIPTQATEVHGITDQDVAGEPGFDHIAPVVQALVDDAILMAYNHAFDKDFLHAELVRAGGHGIGKRHPFIDPMEHFRQHVPHTGNKLTEAVEHYLGRDLKGAHRAIHDTEAMVEVFRCQWETHPEMGTSLEDVLVEHKDWLDPGRKVYQDAAGVARFGFGKHTGEPVTENESYAQWMLGADFDDGTKQVLRDLLER